MAKALRMSQPRLDEPFVEPCGAHCVVQFRKRCPLFTDEELADLQRQADALGSDASDVGRVQRDYDRRDRSRVISSSRPVHRAPVSRDAASSASSSGRQGERVGTTGELFFWHCRGLLGGRLILGRVRSFRQRLRSVCDGALLAAVRSVRVGAAASRV